MENKEYLERCKRGMQTILEKETWQKTDINIRDYLTLRYAYHLVKTHEDSDEFIEDFRECKRCLKALDELGAFPFPKTYFNLSHPFDKDSQDRPNIRNIFQKYDADLDRQPVLS